VLVDVALAVGVFAVIAVAITAELGTPQDRPADVVAFLIAAGLGALMLARRHAPVVVLVATGVGLLAYYAAQYPPVGLALPVAAALYSAAEAGRLWWSVAVAGALVLVSLVARSAQGEDLAFLLGYEMATTAALMAAAIALGYAVAAGRARRAAERRRLELVRDEQRRLAAARLQDQRVQIARELHDVLAHTATVISVHADVADEALDDDPAAARTSVQAIRAASQDALRQLRDTVKVLREQERPEAHLPERGLAELPTLVADMAESGLVVDLREPEAPPTPGSAVDTAAYRIIQESLTNVLRHSRATRASVTITCANDVLGVTVHDPGPAPVDAGGQQGSGHGLDGIRERVRSLGGGVEIGPDDGGFTVRANLPLGEPT